MKGQTIAQETVQLLTRMLKLSGSCLRGGSNVFIYSFAQDRSHVWTVLTGFSLYGQHGSLRVLQNVHRSRKSTSHDNTRVVVLQVMIHVPVLSVTFMCLVSIFPVNHIPRRTFADTVVLLCSHIGCLRQSSSFINRHQIITVCLLNSAAAFEAAKL